MAVNVYVCVSIICIITIALGITSQSRRPGPMAHGELCRKFQGSELWLLGHKINEVMDLNGILQSIEQDVDVDVDGRNFHVNDIARSLDEVAAPDGEDVEMGDADDPRNVLYPSFNSLSLRNRGLQQQEHIEEPNDVQMEDAPVEHEVAVREEPAATTTDGKANNEYKDNHDNDDDNKHFTLNPTTLGAKVASNANEKALVPSLSSAPSSPRKPQHQHQHHPEEYDEDDVFQPIHSSPAPYYEMPIPTPNWIATHDNSAYIISTYLQLAFNICVGSLVLYLISSGLVTFWRDVDYKLESHATEIMAEIQACTRRYLENDCRPDIRAPALEADCERWSKCMDQDTTGLGRTRVTAETVAEIINSFVEPFSYKTILVSTVGLAVGLFVCNFAFGFWRAKAYYNKPHNDLAAKYILQ